MKRTLELVLFALTIYGLLTICSCQKLEEEETIIEDLTPKSFEEDPLYGQLNNNSTPLEFIDVFLQEAELYGYDFRSTITDIEVIPGVDQNGDGYLNESVDICASSFAVCDDARITIVICPYVWERNDFRGKFELMWHELGHDVLNLDHTLVGGHIMSAGLGEITSGPPTNSGDLIYNTNISKWSWKRAVKDMFELKDQVVFNCL